MYSDDVMDYLRSPKTLDLIAENNFPAVFINALQSIRGELVRIFDEATIDFLPHLRMIFSQMYKGVKGNTLDLSEYKNIKLVASSAFSDCSYETIILPESVIRMYDSAFANCNCKYIDISKTKDSFLPFYAFAEALDLQEVRLPDSLRVINNFCFRNCEKLKEINLPKSIEQISSDVFYKCYELAEIKYEGTVADWHKVEKYDAYDTHWDVSHIKVICTNGSTYFLGD